MWQEVEWTGGGTDFGGGDPQVACRRCQAAMAEQQLNGPDIGAGLANDGKCVTIIPISELSSLFRVPDHAE
jgi:riboflavin synthase alpha subunit